ncbi:hypothetical protein N792_07110 [Lysobacter concretionis Ko07 = DSM 16239]|uniref:Uncharacterized protein n=2 Tax=Lysobacterales TaxID=135614 RepID=A0A0A0ENU1_9GAMM|nr:hypothetical protein N792_07110 [Lysobacter concretionis Ko07 = DSM 16239]
MIRRAQEDGMGDHKQHAIKRRELEWLLRDYGVSRSLRLGVAQALSPESLDKLLRQLKRRSIFSLS